MCSSKLKVMVVDDSALYRRIIRNLLEEIEDVEVVGTAANGRFALAKLESLQPDLLTVDLEMPDLDGLGLLRELQSIEGAPGAIMLSALTTDDAKSTTAGLALGAFDFVLKPKGGSPEESMERIRKSLAPKVAAFATSKALSRVRSKRVTIPAESTAPPVKPTSELSDLSVKRDGPIEVVVLGISTGGPAALTRMLPALPGAFPLPILIVQHMPPIFTKSLADDLNRACALTVSEAQDGQAVCAGEVLIAPGGKQMRLEQDENGLHVRITNDPPERSCRPSVDYLFRSVADVVSGRALAVIMTGMGDDGTLGCRLLKRKGATVVVQDEASSVVYGMPRQVVESGVADHVASLSDMPQAMWDLVQKEVRA